MRNRAISSVALVALVGTMFLAGMNAYAAREVRRAAGDEQADLAARRLFKRANELLEAGEEERSIKMMETILDQYPKDSIRYNVYLALGKYYLDVHDQTKAVSYLRHLDRLKPADPEKLLEGDVKDLYLEGLYTMGVSYFQMRQYGKAFSVLRRITNKYPNTVWANQAYYYIGMSHFAQEHWNKAIKSLGMVGTFIDPESPLLEYVEAGHRFHVKILDSDLPLLLKMGKDISVVASTKNGDREVIACAPLVGQPEIFLGSVMTTPGGTKPSDGTLQVIGGDSIDVLYVDDNTKDGTKDVERKRKVKVVSTASLAFTMGTYESKAVGAFLGQPIFVRVNDLDMDKSAGKDTVTVRIVSRFKSAEDEEELVPTATVDIDKLLTDDDKPAYTVRDEITLELVEEGEDPVHTGIYHGNSTLRRVVEGQTVNMADDVLECGLGDELLVTYVDEIHASGDVPRDISDQLLVSGEIDSRPRAAQDIVPDAVVKAKKEMVEAEAYLELARIFKSMGLMKTAGLKSENGLDKVKFTIQTDAPIPNSLKEGAFKLSWELHLAKDDYQSAMATCEVFNRLYPESPLVSDALMGIAKVFQGNGDLGQAKSVLARVLRLPNSFAKAEAQFRIGEIIELEGTRAAEAAAKSARGGVAAAKPGISEAAVREYKICALRYPDSEFAGPSLGKVIDYHIQTKDYAVADDLLEQVFLDYQDEVFLDSMLLKWVIVSYRMGNLEKARNKCQQLIFEYPGSRYARKAKGTLQKIEAKLGTKGGSEDA